MLIKLLPEQAANRWNDVKNAVDAALPPVVGMQADRLQNILTSILTGDMTVWISVEKREKVNEITGMILTTFTLESNSGTKALLIYCLVGYSNSLSASWIEGMDTLKKFAEANNCHRIIGYTDVESIIAFAAKHGAETKYTLVSFPV